MEGCDPKRPGEQWSEQGTSRVEGADPSEMDKCP